MERCITNELAFTYSPSDTVSDLCNRLEHLGKLPQDFDGNSLFPLLWYPNENVRLLAVKTLGKLTSLKYLTMLSLIAYQDKSTMVRREAVSSIGRMRTEETIETLIRTLSDNDPKIVCQAIRGLLVFKGNKKDYLFI